jgi:hypothetical protein
MKCCHTKMDRRMSRYGSPSSSHLTKACSTGPK